MRCVSERIFFPDFTGKIPVHSIKPSYNCTCSSCDEPFVKSSFSCPSKRNDVDRFKNRNIHCRLSSFQSSKIVFVFPIFQICKKIRRSKQVLHSHFKKNMIDSRESRHFCCPGTQPHSAVFLYLSKFCPFGS